MGVGVLVRKVLLQSPALIAVVEVFLFPYIIPDKIFSAWFYIVPFASLFICETILSKVCNILRRDRAILYFCFCLSAILFTFIGFLFCDINMKNLEDDSLWILLYSFLILCLVIIPCVITGVVFWILAGKGGGEKS